MIYLVFGFLLFPFLLLAVIVLDSKMSTVGKMIINLITIFWIICQGPKTFPSKLQFRAKNIPHYLGD